MGDKEGLSAADRIRKFREGRPMSREEREKERQGVNRMWYETGNDEEVERPRALAVGPTGQPSRPSSALRNAREPNDYMASPANSLYQNRKLGASLGVDDMIANEIRQLQAQMEEKERATDRRLNLGSFDPTRSLDRAFDGEPTYRFNARDSADSLPRRSVSPSLRRSVQPPRHDGLSDSTGDFLRKYNIGSFGADAWSSGAYRGDISPLRLSGDVLRSSVETLGSTGFKGLLVPHLKLDGKKEEKPAVVEEPVKSDAELAEMNRQLEELLKSMNANHPPRNEYFPEGVAESILQITNKVQADLMDFKSLFGDKHQREDEEEKELKERDERMKEEGRRQAREKQLLEFDPPATHPLEYFGVWDGRSYGAVDHKLDHFPYPVQQQQPGVVHTAHTPRPQPSTQAGAALGGTAQQQIDLANLRLSDDGSVGPDSPFAHYDSTVLSPDGVQGDAAAGADARPKEGFPVGNTLAAGAAAVPEPVTTLHSAGLLSGGAAPQAQLPSLAQQRSNLRGFGPTAGMMQSALDSELAALDTTHHQIRALHNQLGSRMRQLDALHSSLTVPPAPLQAQTHFLREDARGPARGGIPLYARPNGPPPHMAQGRHAPHSQYRAYPAGLAPMAVADLDYSAPPTRAYSALEEYYNAQVADRLAATEDTRVLFNPFPELVHSNLMGVNRGIHSALDVAMHTLHARLPGEPPRKFTPPPVITPSLAEATAAAQHTVQFAPTPVEFKAAGSAATFSATPAATPAVPSTSLVPKASAELDVKAEANKAATSLVEDVLNMHEYRKSAEGVLTRSAPAPSGAETPKPADPTEPTPIVTPAAAAPAVAAPSLKDYLDIVKGVTFAAAPAVAPSPAASAASSSTSAAPTAAAATLATINPAGKSSREVLAELDSVLGVDDKKSNYLARDLFVPTTTTNTFPAAAGPPSAQDKPFLHAADSYLQARYPPNSFDPRMQYDATARQIGGGRAQTADASNGAPIVIQAPSDRELAQRGPNGGVGAASAPPAAVEFSLARPHSHPAPAPSRLYTQGGTGLVPPDQPQDLYRRHGTSAYPADPRRVVEIANAQHLRRPVEGSAMDYLHENRIAVVATERGNKYVNPYQAQSAPSSSGASGAYNPHYTEAVAQAFASTRHESPLGRADGKGYSESKGSSPNPAKRVIKVPSPTSIAAPHERQAYLMQMKQLRANLTGI